MKRWDRKILSKQEIEADNFQALKLQDNRESSSPLKRAMSFMIQFAAQRVSLQNKELMQSGINLLQELTLYEKVKRFDESFTAIGSIKDERRIKEMKKGVKYPDQKSLIEEGLLKKTPKKKTQQSKPARRCDRAGYKEEKRWSYEDDCKEKEKTSTRWGITLLSIEPMGTSGHSTIYWRLYEACGVYILELEDGTVIHMLVERRYPLSKDLLQRMLDLGLEVERGSIAALDLIRFIKQQIDENDDVNAVRRVLNSPCFMVKSWLVQDQTALGKDYSDLLIADSLLKTIWFINAPCYGNEALASPKANGISAQNVIKCMDTSSKNLED
ncbi:hypothetical protein Tco_1220768 [Tanacetum coccineum]